jgi:hypothetical protein
MATIDMTLVKEDLRVLANATYNPHTLEAAVDRLCIHLGLPRPYWCTQMDRWVMAWDRERNDRCTDHHCPHNLPVTERVL